MVATGWWYINSHGKKTWREIVMDQSVDTLVCIRIKSQIRKSAYDTAVLLRKTNRRRNSFKTTVEPPFDVLIGGEYFRQSTVSR